MKNIISEIRNSFDRFNSRSETAEDKTNDTEGGSIGNIQNEVQRKKELKIWKDRFSQTYKNI